MSGLESAIAPHLVEPRTRQTRKSAAFTPPYPSFSARFPTGVVSVVMAYFGVQHAGDAPAEVAAAAADEVAALSGRLAATDGADSVEHARYVDERGHVTTVIIAYWTDPAGHARWTAGAPGWTDPAHRRTGLGFFLEMLTPSVDRFETLFSNDRLEGVARLADGLSGEIREHGYWGGARDRLPLAQTDALDATGAPDVRDDGVLRVTGPDNLCLIRSGQEWSETDGEERRMYTEDVEPVLRAGMDFLRDDGLGVGCYANRYMTVVDAQGHPSDKTFGMSWWHSLEELDTWAESHPTHVAIFRVAMKYLGTLGPAARLRLYHEVTVASADQQRFEYLDCHPGTGLLRATGVPGT
ncbi:phenylacetaldoxime dehydratase family protein [Modestobacter marinus]|uniref:Aldoxime dehydratase n=1 Tax=Modestobacter marinus TaxID=477641 RepID=A0A846LWS1_9ACTN|nr:phenylacetaldoxime dehydratase family protein [Modestobacter marinus]NIH70185.1 aldoxime dehydratase [Modestobacter marinus]GGL76323.1 phenylacetaldoxime dehydratase [Modestobacter marinus]